MGPIPMDAFCSDPVCELTDGGINCSISAIRAWMLRYCTVSGGSRGADFSQNARSLTPSQH